MTNPWVSTGWNAVHKKRDVAHHGEEQKNKGTTTLCFRYTGIFILFCNKLRVPVPTRYLLSIGNYLQIVALFCAERSWEIPRISTAVWRHFDCGRKSLRSGTGTAMLLLRIDNRFGHIFQLTAMADTEFRREKKIVCKGNRVAEPEQKHFLVRSEPVAVARPTAPVPVPT